MCPVERCVLSLRNSAIIHLTTRQFGRAILCRATVLHCTTCQHTDMCNNCAILLSRLFLSQRTHPQSSSNTVLPPSTFWLRNQGNLDDSRFAHLGALDLAVSRFFSNSVHVNRSFRSAIPFRIQQNKFSQLERKPESDNYSRRHYSRSFGRPKQKNLLCHLT